MNIHEIKKNLESCGADIREKREALRVDLAEMQKAVAAGQAGREDVAFMLKRCRQFHKIFKTYEAALRRFKAFLTQEIMAEERCSDEIIH